MKITGTCMLLKPGDWTGFAEMLAIYQAAIVASEQKKPAELEAMLADAQYRVLVMREDSRVIGFAIIYLAKSKAFWLLEYMAVDQALRSKGYGERIFFAAKDVAAESLGGAPCVLEVDQPLGASAEEASRRLRFYRRIGCRRLKGVDYILPLKTGGTPPPMWLLVHGLEGLDAISYDAAEAWLRAIYTEVYGQQPDDPRIITMLSHGDGLNTVGLQQAF